MTQSELTVQVTPLPVKPGEEVLGKYRVERVIGTGGMGAVVAATHLELEQLVAIKFLYTHAQNHPEALARFKREARAAVKLRSEHVARVIDVGQLETGAPFIVMEFLEGDDLGEVILSRGALPSNEAVGFVLQACEAVGEAHSLGIVHRDLKPKNLFLTKTAKGQPLVKVLDFGISKLITGDDLSLTRTQSVIGSPNYMSPEQLRSARDVDQRADIWAIGAILYELLTAHVPFPAETVTQLTAMVIADPPTPIESYRTDLSEGLKAIVQKCLAKNRDDRYATVEELAQALLPFASEGTHFAVPAHSSTDALSTSGEQRPADRPSFRVPGGETSSAWGDTQLAGAPTTRRWPIIAAASAFALVAGVVAVVGWSSHRTPGAGKAAETVTVTATAPPAATPSPTPVQTAAANTNDMPTTRNLPPGNPLVSPTGGPVRPIPTSFSAAKKDAGPATTVAPPALTGDDLPTVRH